MHKIYRVNNVYFSLLKALRYLFTYRPYYLNHFLLLYVNRALKIKPMPQISEVESFKELNAIWRPSRSKSRIILRWCMTEWCNYNCIYCPQEHSRDRIRGSFRAHCFDNYTPVEWIRAIDRAFKMKEVAVTISGGEPMLDMKNMSSFLKMLLTRTYINNVQITTNMAWNPSSIENLPNKEKMIFLTTFHPSQTRFGDFITRVDKLKKLGFPIGFVNYVMTPEQSLNYVKLKDKFKKVNLPLNPDPLWFSKPDDDLKKILKRILEKADLYYNTGGTTRGKVCYFPSIGYEMSQNGEINVGCFHWISGNFFRDEIPELIEGPVKCPHYQCRCIGKYSFIKSFNRNVDMNIYKIYGNILRKHFGLPRL